MAPTLKIQRHYPNMPLPERGHPRDAGLDLTAMAVEVVRAGVYSVDTGISVQPPEGFYCEVVPRSSIVKGDFMQANSIGIIDPDYRGKILVVLRYLGPGEGAAEARALIGKRVAQLLLRRLELPQVESAQELDTTVRGTGGFGSTGN
jgi:dUTP pyrophosphatase